MSDSSAQALKGVIDRLKAVTAVTDIVSTRIYTNVPEDPTFPFIMIRMDSSPFAAKDFSDQEHTFNIQGFSRKQSPLQAMQIRSAVFDALDRQEENITVAGKNVVKCNYDGLSFLDKEPDGATWQSLISFVLTIN